MFRLSYWLRTALPLLLAGAFSGRAHAAEAARLVYGRTVEAQACPDESALREAVARRLGYDPFVTYSALTLVVEIRGDESGLSARVYRVDSGNVAGGVRQLSSPSLDCKELSSAVALAISIALDPDSIERLSAATASTAPDEKAPETSIEDAPVRPPEVVPEAPTASVARDHGATESRAVRNRPGEIVGALGAGGLVATGPEPPPVFGITVFSAVRSTHWEVSLSPRWNLPSSAGGQQSTGEAQMTSYGASLVPCYRYERWLGCYVFDAALLASKGKGVSHPQSDESFWSAHGARVAYRFGAERGFGVVVRLDGLWAPERIAVRLAGAEVFETPSFLVRGGVDASYEF